MYITLPKNAELLNEWCYTIWPLTLTICHKSIILVVHITIISSFSTREVWRPPARSAHCSPESFSISPAFATPWHDLFSLFSHVCFCAILLTAMTNVTWCYCFLVSMVSERCMNINMHKNRGPATEWTLTAATSTVQYIQLTTENNVQLRVISSTLSAKCPWISKCCSSTYVYKIRDFGSQPNRQDLCPAITYGSDHTASLWT